MKFRSDFDSAWKDALEAYFPQFMGLLQPELHAQIDWQYAPEFLDKELQALMRSRSRGRQHVDKLARVRMQAGHAALVLIHVEIQSHRHANFAPRMFAYHIRLSEKHPQQPVVSLAVLTGKQAAQSAADATKLTHAYDNWGCSLHFSFPVVYLEHWRARIDELLQLAPHNPFAVVILAQLEANATQNPEERLVRKTELVRRLYYWGFSRDNVIQLFRIIDAMVGLPESLEDDFDEAVIQIEEETQMTYVTSIERVRLRKEREAGMQEGLLRGEQDGLQKGLQKGQLKGAAEVLAAQVLRKFGHLPDWARVRMKEADEATLNRWALQILDAPRIEDVFV